MELKDVINQFETIFKDVLDEDDIELNESTTAADIEEWDSLSHIQLVVGIEKHFNIKFTSLEIESYNNVGEMCKAVIEKTAS